MHSHASSAVQFPALKLTQYAHMSQILKMYEEERKRDEALLQQISDTEVQS